MMELLKTCCKKLKILYRDIKYWFILNFDKSVFTILLEGKFFNKYDIITTEANIKLIVIKAKNNLIYVKCI